MTTHQDIPDDVYLDIIGMLSYEDVLNLALSNKYFLPLLGTEYVWRLLIIRDYGERYLQEPYKRRYLQLRQHERDIEVESNRIVDLLPTTFIGRKIYAIVSDMINELPYLSLPPTVRQYLTHMASFKCAADKFCYMYNMNKIYMGFLGNLSGKYYISYKDHDDNSREIFSYVTKEELVAMLYSILWLNINVYGFVDLKRLQVNNILPL